MSAIDLIKNTIPIIDVLERYAGVNLIGAKSGRKSFNIRCPYHNDKTPSFTVYTDTNTFKCWAGCNDGKSGDVIDIVKLSTNLDTKQAIKILISDFGLKNPSSEQAKEWKKIRASREQSAAILKGLDKKVNDSISALKNIEIALMKSLSTIQTVEDMDRLGELYHVLAQVGYWLDSLIENDPVVQVQTLDVINHCI